ncbi:arginine deiminase-related protein [uncultured Bacteroides sp.]|uniref:arginine deiminase-related protein n=1 Tax=uncultured Bacteroides sp. TaxID=162156 RepID=UPI002AABE61D|nr:arginine deiminase-related protein [uncultured Bacteroides sp.]
MIEPVAFEFNEETAANNYFQQCDQTPATLIQDTAREEFTAMVNKLRAKGLKVISIADTPEPKTPDSIFPNNWVSFHRDGRVALYPMFAPNRRAERRIDILQKIQEEGFQINVIRLRQRSYRIPHAKSLLQWSTSCVQKD